MGLCLGFESALQHWLTKGEDEAVPEGTDTGRFAFAQASSRLARREHLPLEPSEKRPLHLMVPNQTVKHRLDGFEVHVCSTRLPEHSFRRLSGDNLVASPELTFLELAQTYSLWELVEVGNYLCSTFSIDDAGRGYTGRRAQVTTPEQLCCYLDELPQRMRGVRRARQALKHVVELTASPKESQLAMHYHLPAELGGRGPFDIVANQAIQIDEHGQRLLGSGYLVGDLLLPDFKCDLEFDSIKFHTGRFRLDHTQTRRNILEAMGIKTVSATEGQINTLEKLDDFTWLLEERLGIPHPTYTREQRLAQIYLFDWLNDPQRSLF